MALPTITVAIPCFNEEERIPALAAMLGLLDPAPDAVLLLDDGSTDGTATAIRAAGLPLLVQPANLGLGAGRNLLFQESCTELVTFLDADVVAPPDWILQVRQRFAGDEAVVGVGGFNRENALESGADRFRSRHWRQWNGPEATWDAPWLVGACATYRRAALQAVGGFDESFRTHGEDVDLGLRLRTHGYRLRYDPTLQVTHQRRDDLASLVKMCHRHCLWGGIATLKNGGTLRPLMAGMAKKALFSTGGMLLKHHDPQGALASFLGCGAGMWGYGQAGWRSWR